MPIKNKVEKYDLVEMELGENLAGGFQPENRPFDFPFHVTILRRPAPFEMLREIQKNLYDDVWLLESDQAFLRADYAEMSACRTLALIAPRNVVWRKILKNSKPQVRARFAFKEHIYDLPVTDYITEEPLFQDLPIGDHPESTVNVASRTGYDYEEAVGYVLQFAVSLGKRYGENCYKLIAGVLSMPMRDADPKVSKLVEGLLEILHVRGLTYVDNRPSGRLWVVGGKEEESQLIDLRKYGFKFRFCEGGARASGYRPAWFLE